MEIDFTQYDVWAAGFGILLSLVFGFVPIVRDWFNDQSDQFKQAFMLVGNLVIGLIIGLLTDISFGEILKLWMVAVSGNTIIFSATKRIRPGA